jgi:branched-chain amino acid transport system permease protein
LGYLFEHLLIKPVYGDHRDHLKQILVIGGMGTLNGAAIGAVLFVLAQNCLRDIMGQVSAATTHLPFLPDNQPPGSMAAVAGHSVHIELVFFSNRDSR